MVVCSICINAMDETGVILLPIWRHLAAISLECLGACLRAPYTGMISLTNGR